MGWAAIHPLQDKAGEDEDWGQEQDSRAFGQAWPEMYLQDPVNQERWGRDWWAWGWASPTTVKLPLKGVSVPVNSPVVNPTMLSGPKGPVLAGMSLQRILAPRPYPPSHFLKKTSSRCSSLIFPDVRLTFKIFPKYLPKISRKTLKEMRFVY